MILGIDNRPISRGASPLILGPQKVAFSAPGSTLFGLTGVFKSIQPVGPVNIGQAIKASLVVRYVSASGGCVLALTNAGNTSQCLYLAAQGDKNFVFYKYSGGAATAITGTGAGNLANWVSAMPMFMDLTIASDGTRTSGFPHIMHTNMITAVNADPSFAFALTGMIDIYVGSSTGLLSDVYSCVAQIQ